MNQINSTIKSISENLEELTPEEIENLFFMMKDIFYFYGFTGEIIQDMIREGKIPYTYPVKKYSELLGVMNAMLFRLKYRREQLQPLNDNENLGSNLDTLKEDKIN